MNGLRYFISTLIAVAVTLAAFFVMQGLIANDGQAPQAQASAPVIRFGAVKMPDPPTPKTREEKPEPPENEPPPVTPRPVVPQQTEVEPQDIGFDPPTLAPVDGIATRIPPGPEHAANEEGEAVPLVKIQPRYPRKAALNRVEGWVKLHFTITPAGTVTDARVVDANPSGVFDQSAVRAILQWRFKPRVVDGQPVSRQATQVIEFDLGDRRG